MKRERCTFLYSNFLLKLTHITDTLPLYHILSENMDRGSMSADISFQYELLSKTTMANRLFLVPSIHTEYQNNQKKSGLKNFVHSGIFASMKIKQKLLNDVVPE